MAVLPLTALALAVLLECPDSWTVHARAWTWRPQAPDLREASKMSATLIVMSISRRSAVTKGRRRRTVEPQGQPAAGRDQNPALPVGRCQMNPLLS